MPTKDITIGKELPGRRLSWGGSTLDVALFGAHITSWTTPGAVGAPVERLWMSTCSPMDGSGPIRGGIPIVWPQFANDGPLPLHGFARELPWSVVESADDKGAASTSVTLELTESEQTLSGAWREPAAAPFPWKFRLRLKVTLGAMYMQLRLEATNRGHVDETAGPVGGEPLEFTTCFHTYFRTADSTEVRLNGGLRDTTFVDKVDGGRSKRHGSAEGTPLHTADNARDMLRIEQAASESQGFVDRIYCHDCHESTEGGVRQLLSVGRALDPDDPTQVFTYDLHQSDAFSNTVVFNPWKEGKRGPAHPDFDDDGYQYMICVEPAVAKPSTPVSLLRNRTWKGECYIGIN